MSPSGCPQHRCDPGDINPKGVTQLQEHRDGSNPTGVTPWVSSYTGVTLVTSPPRGVTQLLWHHGGFNPMGVTQLTKCDLSDLNPRGVTQQVSCNTGGTLVTSNTKRCHPMGVTHHWCDLIDLKPQEVSPNGCHPSLV
ncbi:hypothetical protein HGM15179_020509 [Zosterops borbonicus]|uniref:Uncharacterized protein n=1 Tax=Zosterops borbonicus TaxID=364589 RepID=A0A8K1D7M3_9PASS|nr:hypothetical protein HGM15179_020509 [Zosterops borbonicus]